MEGDPVDMILRAAEETHSDVIVMGTHGRTALARLAARQRGGIGAAQGTCPVLTAKPLAVRNKTVEESRDERGSRRRRWAPMPSEPLAAQRRTLRRKRK